VIRTSEAGCHVPPRKAVRLKFGDGRAVEAIADVVPSHAAASMFASGSYKVLVSRVGITASNGLRVRGARGRGRRYY